MINRIKILVILISFSAVSVTYPQDLEKDANANFRDFYLHLALKQYLELYEQDSTNLQYNYRIGFCYLNLELDKSLALPFLLKAYRGNYEEPTILLDLGLSYFYDEQFDKAIEYFQQFRQVEKNKDLIQYADDYINYTSNAKAYMKNPVNVTFHFVIG